MVFVDGHNFYGGIASFGVNRYKWCDLAKLCNQFVKKDTQVLQSILYCSAYCTWNNNKRRHHEIYVKILKDSDIKILMGEYKSIPRKFRKTQMSIRQIEPPNATPPDFMEFMTHEEKRTDVNIALKIFEYAYQDEYDHAFIISGDSDIVPAVELTQKYFGKKFTCILPPNVKGKELSDICLDGRGKIKEKTIKHCLLDENYILKNGDVINMPQEYQN